MKKSSLASLVSLSLLLCIVLPLGAQTSPTIKIVKPLDRHNVALAKQDITVEISGAALSAGYSWQLLIDGVLEATVRDALVVNVQIPEPSGPHRLKAVLLDPRGNSVASHEILVLAAPVESQTPVFDQSRFGPLMGVFVVVILGIIFIGLRLRPRTAT